MSGSQAFASAALTLVLVVAAWSKVRDRDRFATALSTYRAIPRGAVPLLTVLVPATELAFAVALWTLPQPATGVGLCAMFLAFTLLLAHALLRRDETDCGCFGSRGSQKVSWFSIARNLVLIALAVGAAYGTSGDVSEADALPAVLAGVATGGILLILDEAVALLSHDRPSARRARS